MGTFINPEATAFVEALNSQVYVDKTMLIKYTNEMANTEQKYICVSRPRRFGKTMAINMLAAYYCNKRAADIFGELAIYSDKSFAAHAGQYIVLRLTMTEFFGSAATIADGCAKLVRKVSKEIKRLYKEIYFSDCEDFVDYFRLIYEEQKQKIVILIDEWDCVFREKPSQDEGHRQYLDFLRDWLKNQDFIALVYMTGILPIKKYGKHSALNMFYEYSMEHSYQLAEFVGFTDGEVKKLCARFSMSYEECKSWYDGYQLAGGNIAEISSDAAEEIYDIYNPYAIVRAIIHRSFGNYWNKTETYEALGDYIKLEMAGLKDSIISLLAGEELSIDTKSFANDMTSFKSADDILTLLIHLGYLKYNTKAATVSIPNNEIRSEFALSIKENNNFQLIYDAIRKSEKLLEATINCEADTVAKFIEKAHLETSILQYNDENALAYTIALAYYTARRKYRLLRELPTGKGFADMVFLPLPQYRNLPAIIVELKWNHSAKTAISQIKKQEYPEVLNGYERNVLLVGINYSKATKKHTCLIEKIEI